MNKWILFVDKLLPLVKQNEICIVFIHIKVEVIGHGVLK